MRRQRLRPVRAPGRHHRHEGQAHEQRQDLREGHGQRLVAKQLAGDAADEHHREEHRDGRQRRSRDRHRDLRRPFARGPGGGHAHLALAGDGLEDHHRVVDQHADRERDAAERHDVERQVEAVHQHENADHRDRDHDARDQRRARVAQEEVQHDHREESAPDRRVAHLAHGVRDESRLVVDRLELRVGRQVPAEFGEPRVNRLRELHRVRVAFLVHRELDTLPAVQSRDGRAVLVTLFDPCHVAQVDGAPVNRGDHRVGHLPERAEFVERAHEEALRSFLEPAAGEIDVLRAYARRDLCDIEVQLGEALLVDVDVHLVFEAAAHLDRRRSFGCLEGGFQAVVGEAAQRLQPLVARSAGSGEVDECEAQHGFGRRVEAQEQRPARVERQLQQVEALAHLDAREIHVGAPDELEHDIRLPGARNGAHTAHIADGAGRLFDRARDQVLDFERRRARQFGADRQRRVRQVGKQVDLEARQRDDTEQRHGDGRHRDRDAAAQGEIDDAHGDPRAPISGSRCASRRRLSRPRPHATPRQASTRATPPAPHCRSSGRSGRRSRLHRRPRRRA
ncbi:MAG: hypothetical protein CMLOHMNK_01904 [Steroidobacteraceae bacterium]|nr:hypothetical protein [Steroidobacteraceae bacterium]